MNYPYPYPSHNPIVPSQKQIHEFKQNEKYRYEQRIQDNIIKIKNIYRLISKQQHDGISDDDMPIDDMNDISELNSWIKHVKRNNPTYDNLLEDQQDRLIAIAMDQNRIPTPPPTKGGRKTRKIKKRKIPKKEKHIKEIKEKRNLIN